MVQDAPSLRSSLKIDFIAPGILIHMFKARRWRAVPRTRYHARISGLLLRKDGEGSVVPFVATESDKGRDLLRRKE